MDIRKVREKDITEWMRLVKTVKASFPGLETEEALQEHEATVMRFMKNEEAVAAFEKEKLVGAVLYAKESNMICFLAVDPGFRRKGIASALLNVALGEFDEEKEVVVSTYRDADKRGSAARQLYKSLGFVPEELVWEFGYPCQIFRLHRDNGNPR